MQNREKYSFLRASYVVRKQIKLRKNHVRRNCAPLIVLKKYLWFRRDMLKPKLIPAKPQATSRFIIMHVLNVM